MRVLHILKTQPDDEARQLIDALSEGEDAVEAQLFSEPVDYAHLMRKIFESDKVLCWW